MLYPNLSRVPTSGFKSFYLSVVKPSLPQPRGMPNGSPNTPLREEMNGAGRKLMVANTYYSLLLGIR